MSGIIPYRSTPKLSHLLQSQAITITDALNVQQIPKFQPKVQDKAALKHLHGKKSWFMDFIYLKRYGEVIQEDNEENESDKFIILLCVHCNSRYTIASIVPSRENKYIRPLILWIYQRGLIDTLITDAESGFNTFDTYIKHITYNMNAMEEDHVNAHVYLAPIDRMARTLRDMVFNAKRFNKTFELNADTLQEILKIYNTTPHATLTEIMGFPVSPVQMLVFPILQDEFIRRVLSYNMRLMDSVISQVKVGDIVYLHQPRKKLMKRRNSVEDDEYVVSEIHGGKFILTNTKHPHVHKIAHRKDFILS